MAGSTPARRAASCPPTPACCAWRGARRCARATCSPPETARNPAMPQSSFHVDNLHKRFGEREVLRGVSLAGQPGEVVTLIGASGSGKSTFLRCLNLLEQPHEGMLRIGDE